MNDSFDIKLPEYNPDRLINVLRMSYRVKNDTALARILDIRPTTLSLIRRRKKPVAASLLIRIYEVSGIEISDLRCLMGDRRRKYRTGYFQGRKSD